jgi:ABC-type lipoprotein release transport system permease subunit
VAGSAAGLIITLALVRRLDPLLFGVDPADLRTLGLVSGLLLAVAVVACWIPGRRAARIRPVEVMNSE